MFLATTTGTLLGGVGTDDWGDPIDVDMVRMENVPASILEGPPISSSRPVEGRTDQVNSFTLRVHPNVDLQKYNRFRDNKTGYVYVIDAIMAPVNPVGHRSFSATCRRVT